MPLRSSNVFCVCPSTGGCCAILETLYIIDVFKHYFQSRVFEYLLIARTSNYIWLWFGKDYPNTVLFLFRTSTRLYLDVTTAATSHCHLHSQ